MASLLLLGCAAGEDLGGTSLGSFSTGDGDGDMGDAETSDTNSETGDGDGDPGDGDGDPGDGDGDTGDGDGDTGDGDGDTGDGDGDTGDGDGDTGDGDGDTGGVCGDGQVDPGEACDDGGESETCNGDCTQAACGDGLINASAGEICDDMGESQTCNADCTTASCGDGVLNVLAGEQCDDQNLVETDACTSECLAATCGDAFVWAGNEECDDGINDNSYGGCSPTCTLAPHCGDGMLTDPPEMCDTALADPYVGVGCKADVCVHDFSTVPQLYCNGSCSWAGGSGCDQADADIFCKLRTGNPLSTATNFSTTTALAQNGFSCAGYGMSIGSYPEFGVNQTVWYQSTSVAANHGPGTVIIDPTCTNP